MKLFGYELNTQKNLNKIGDNCLWESVDLEKDLTDLSLCKQCCYNLSNEYLYCLIGEIKINYFKTGTEKQTIDYMKKEFNRKNFTQEELEV